LRTGGAKLLMNDAGYLLDASAALALIYNEPGAERVAEVLSQACISAVNLSEVIGKLHDRNVSERNIELNLADLDIEVLAFDRRMALRTAALRPVTRHLGLSLGDRACLATAEATGRVVLTADQAWARLDEGIVIEIIR
jgi:ribonuclease VapC